MSALPGLLPAFFRGIPFEIPDVRTEVGRRVSEQMFPGLDRAAYDDFGKLPGLVTIDGFVIGDDYILRAKALEAAFETAGPATLIHPWLGALRVVLDEAAEISFSARELRIARVSFRAKRLPAGGAAAVVSTLAALAGRITGLIALASALMSSPARRSLSRARSLASVRSARVVSDLWVAAGLGAALPAAAGFSPDGFAAAVSASGAALMGRLATATPAVAPAASAPTIAAPVPLDLYRSVREVAVALAAAAGDAPSEVDRAMLAGAGADLVARMADLASSADFATRTDAISTRVGFGVVAGLIEDALDPLSTTVYAGEASAVLRGLATLKSALAADINEAIGRLPAILTLTIDRPVSAMLIAQHLYGSQPTVMEAGYRSIIARTPHRHPAALPAGTVEGLK